MKTKILMTVSFLATMAVTVPAMADSSVLCSVRQTYKNGSVGADYKPGVDAKGKPVVSADLAPAPFTAPKSLTLPLNIDMAQRLNEVLPAGGKLEGQVGTVEIQQDGRVLINGKDMTGAADAACVTIAKQKAAALKTNDVPKVRKKKAAPKAAVTADVPPVEAAPAAQVQAEPVPAPAAEAAPAPAPVPAPAPEPVPAAPVPQVLDAAPPALPAPTPAPAPVAPQPTPIATEPAPVAPAPAPGAAPTPPASGAIVSPTEAGNVPRAPLDPLTGAPAPAPVPAPAPGTEGTLSGGSQ